MKVNRNVAFQDMFWLFFASNDDDTNYKNRTLISQGTKLKISKCFIVIIEICFD